jgi:hypothetical protein
MPATEHAAMTTNAATIVEVSGGDDDEATARSACGAHRVASEVRGALAGSGAPATSGILAADQPSPAQRDDIALVHRTCAAIAPRSVGHRAQRKVRASTRAADAARCQCARHRSIRGRAALDVAFSARQAPGQVAVVVVLRDGIEVTVAELLDAAKRLAGLAALRVPK